MQARTQFAGLTVLEMGVHNYFDCKMDPQRSHIVRQYKVQLKQHPNNHSLYLLPPQHKIASVPFSLVEWEELPPHVAPSRLLPLETPKVASLEGQRVDLVLD